MPEAVLRRLPARHPTHLTPSASLPPRRVSLGHAPHPICLSLSPPRLPRPSAPQACREFEANVIILHHSTTICCGYQPVVHCGVLRQSAEMIEIRGRENLKTGERAIVKFRFLYFADYLVPGSTFLFREGRAKGIGKVLKVYPVNATTSG